MRFLQFRVHDWPSWTTMSTGWPSRTTVRRTVLAGPVFLDLGQKLLDGANPLVIDGDDQVGGLGVEAPRTKPGAIRSTFMRTG